MSGFVLLCAVYCAVRGAWVVGIEVCDALAQAAEMVRASRKRRQA